MIVMTVMLLLLFLNVIFFLYISIIINDFFSSVSFPASLYFDGHLMIY